MSNLEIVKYVLDLVTAHEIEKAKELIQHKQQQFKQERVRSVRKEISEIISTMNRIDMEMIQFKLKKLQLERLCPDSLMQSLENYMADLQQQRKVLATEKSKMTRQHSKT
ncbi:hypothetical protein [Bacillus sp. T3]|uniref:hypothetical protein n=1 Tax=Bacillus sp. T3 TaxID=467262 RepID=UPI0029812DF9|nr:hypothetical protein [Bacillus sp. T3]